MGSQEEVTEGTVTGWIRSGREMGIAVIQCNSARENPYEGRTTFVRRIMTDHFARPGNDVLRKTGPPGGRGDG